MISLRWVEKYCAEDISKIENYNEAIKDKTKIWNCHHRLEIQGDEVYSPDQLKEMGLYYHRPASELIFLTKEEHNTLHHKGKSIWNKGLKWSEEVKRKISEGRKGKRLGMKLSEEWKRKISEGRRKNIANKGVK